MCILQLAFHFEACVERGALLKLLRQCFIHMLTNMETQDIHGDVWTGHKDGYVRIWSEVSHNPV